MTPPELLVLRKQMYVAYGAYIEALNAYTDSLYAGKPERVQQVVQACRAAAESLDASFTVLIQYLVSIHPKEPWPGELERTSRMQIAVQREIVLVK